MLALVSIVECERKRERWTAFGSNDCLSRVSDLIVDESMTPMTLERFDLI